MPLQDVFTNIEEEFKRATAAANDSVQKTKKQKQAIETPVSRKGAPAAPDGGQQHNKENVDRSNAIESEQETSIVDAANASSRPVRERRTKLQNLVSKVMIISHSCSCSAVVVVCLHRGWGTNK